MHIVSTNSQFLFFTFEILHENVWKKFKVIVIRLVKRF